MASPHFLATWATGTVRSLVYLTKLQIGLTPVTSPRAGASYRNTRLQQLVFIVTNNDKKQTNQTFDSSAATLWGLVSNSELTWGTSSLTSVGPSKWRGLAKSFFREERCYVNGRLDGPAKYIYSKSGAEENRIYENGILQGRAVKQTPSGECEERNYERGVLSGEV